MTDWKNNSPTLNQRIFFDWYFLKYLLRKLRSSVALSARDMETEQIHSDDSDLSVEMQ